ncbi:MAG: sigma-70 family RNA polymerase sigma factor [Gaiellaceae bacterium]
MRVRKDVSKQTTLDNLEALYQTGLSRYARVAAGITGDVESGLDAVHNAFVECIRTRHSYRQDGVLEAWVWRAVVNSALKVVRSRRLEIDGESLDWPAPDRDAGLERAEEIRDRIKALPEQQRLILFLRYYADLDYATIADALRIRSGTVGAALHTAHATLRQRLEKERCHE